MSHAGFTPLMACWVCGGTGLRAVTRARFELSEYSRQDPELARYTDATVAVVRCARCGFAQPAELPSLPDYFARMYDQRWSEAWMAEELRSGLKDRIFREVLRGLARRLDPSRRTLLDLGAHVGRMIQLAAGSGWFAEGVELNPSTARFAAESTGLTVHRADARTLARDGGRWAAVTLIDVLEHIPDPVEALRGAAGVIEPGGWLVVKVPHGPNQLRKERIRERVRPGYRGTVADNLVHVNHFGARSLRLALEAVGLESVSIVAAPPETVPGAGRASAANAVRLAVWSAARLLPPDSPLALNLLAYARKPR
jgi:SAM-dependent methyltransferase